MVTPRTPTLAFLLACLVSPLSAQTPPVPDQDPALPDALKQVRALVKDRKMQGDFDAIGLIQKHCKDADKKNPKDQKLIAKELVKVFTTGKVREGAKDVLYREAAGVLAKLGDLASKDLAKLIEHKRFKDNDALRAFLLLRLGETKDPKQIDFLLETTSRSHIDELRAAAGEALANFGKAKEKEQREIVKQILRAWGSLHSLATQPISTDPNQTDFGPQNARRTLDKVEGKWRTTLQKLTGVSHRKFPDWQRWHNKNKDWEPPR